MRSRISFYIVIFTMVFLKLGTSVSFGQYTLEECNECVEAYGGNAGCFSFPISEETFNAAQYSNNSPWELVLEDNFDGNYLNANNWFQIIQLGNPGVTCNDYDSDNLTVNGGLATLRLLYDPQSCEYVSGFTPFQTSYTNTNWSFAPLVSAMNFGPGKFEMRAKIPKISGSWLAFWLYEQNHVSNYSNEIDIFEMKQDAKVENDCPVPIDNCLPEYLTMESASKRYIMTSHSQIIYGDSTTACGPQRCLISPEPYYNIFHTYGVEWDENKISWYIDDSVVYSRPRFWMSVMNGNYYKEINFVNPATKMQLRVDATINQQNTFHEFVYDIAGNLVPWCAPPINSDFVIDYIRIYKRSCGTGNRILCYNLDYPNFFDPNNALVKAATIDLSDTCSTWKVNSGQSLQLGATDEIKLVNFEAHLGSDFVATINSCGGLQYRGPENDENQMINPEFNNYQSTLIPKFNISPNPNNGNFVISNPNKELDVFIEVIDILGNVIFKKLNSSFENEIIDISPLSSGIYIVRITNSKGINECHKIIKE